jgi:hypothetical protein
MIVMKKLIFYIVLFLGVCLNSCITYIEDISDIKPKLVLFCFLVPQLDTTFVSITNSVPLFSSNKKMPERITNATVEISENNIEWVELTLEKEHKLYMITQTVFPIKEGETYYIRASAPEFEAVSASCTVPFFRETNPKLFTEESINDVHGGQIYSDLHYHRHFEWDDYAGEDNYYIFCENGTYWDYIYDYEEEWEGLPWDRPPSDSVLYHFWGIFYDDNYHDCIYSDQGQDGKRMSSKLLTPWYTPDRVSKATLLQTDRSCYMFHKNYDRYDPSMQFFMLEPVQFFTNVKNGYGVFGAFVMKEYEFEVSAD